MPEATLVQPATGRTATTGAASLDPPTFVIEPGRGLIDLDLGAIWQRRELLYFLVWRDVKVRYKQTAIGAAWAVLSPLLTVLIFAVVFGRLAKIPSDGLPYIVFAFAGFLPWTYFAQAFGRSSASLVGNAHLITKVYFPRLMIPLAAVHDAGVDFGLSLLSAARADGLVPDHAHVALLALPGFLVLAAVIALAVGLWLAPHQRPLPRRQSHRAVSRPGLDVLLARRVPHHARPRAVAARLQPESHGRRDRGIPLVHSWGRRRPTCRRWSSARSCGLTCLSAALVFFRRMERAFADVI